MLKESFGQLWSYERKGWARRFFDNWRASLKWQRLKPYEKFAEMIERHWDGIASYCHPENKVSLGFVEGLNNKIRVIQRRAYGLRDEEYLRLKILTCMLPRLFRQLTQDWVALALTLSQLRLDEARRQQDQKIDEKSVLSNKYRLLRFAPPGYRLKVASC